MLNKVLLIDDDIHLLESAKRNLRREFEVHTATNGQEGLELLRRQGPFTVLVSDLQMPQMDGIEVLSRARKISPETVRILLTGHMDQEVAIKATNTGKVFRFLTKPCDTQTLITTLQEATLQHRMQHATQEMKEGTLVGVVGLLSQLLGQINPEAQNKANRLKRYSLHIARESGYREPWLVEIAAMLSQIGHLSIPASLLQKQQNGSPLAPEENAMLAEHPGVASELLLQVPGFEDVVAIIGLAHGGKSPQQELWEAENTALITQGGKILKTAMALDQKLIAGQSSQEALEGLYLDPTLDQELTRTCQSYPFSFKLGDDERKE